ncbi:DUF3841 domain-containing protein [Bacillus wiedmannii]|uniref:DUF3841 domain-containing protein n=1 Tax=Bacillus wiedmannii TaxID=1890302 RepID=A0ABD6TUV4_9BACI|nr:DUF3841 domain-containing protein [Bacillus wiedmannii]PEO53914.1 hypothetical protein CN560_28135 [Bacillus wiedmannii]PGC78751.1 hypothetical protein COM25_00155 [Bacillus wiedmannii]PHG24394.1 hypothetical protein COI74_02980 [Bacillus wiedmannii]
MRKQFDKQSNLNTSMDSTILWTFQNKNAINILLNTGKLIADPIFVSKEYFTAYKYIVRHMKQSGINFIIDLPIWAWHSCNSYKKKPTVETARELLSDIQLEKEIYLTEFTCPNFLFMLTNYSRWCDIYFKLTDNPKAIITSDEEKYLFDLYPAMEEEWEYHHIQATLPYLKKEWIIQITELSKMNGFNK